MPKRNYNYRNKKANGKNATGAPTKYKPEYCEALIRFFDIASFNVKDITITYKDGTTKEVTEREANPLPQLIEFAHSIKVSYMTVHRWAGLDVDSPAVPEFRDAYIEAMQHRNRIVIQNGLLGLYNGYFAKFFAENCMGWNSKPEEETRPQNVTVTFTTQPR